MHVSLRRFILSLAALAFAGSGMAQVATGTYAYGTFDNKGFDSVNVGSLNVHFSIPVLNKAGRGIPFSYNLSFDNSVWYPTAVSGVQSWVPTTNFGWRGDTEIEMGYLSYNQSIQTISGILPPPEVATTEETASPLGAPGSYTCTITSYNDWAYHDAFGVVHPLAGGTTSVAGTANCRTLATTQATARLQAIDGSGYTLNLESFTVGTMISTNGKQINVPVINNGSATATDANGNQISVDGSGHFTDTTGNVVLTVAGSAPSAHTFTYTDTVGNPQSVTMSYKTYTVQTNFGCSGIGEYGPTSTSLVDAISFPDGSAYHFIYEATPGSSVNVTGRLATVTLPAGGAINYSYVGGNNGIECGDGSSAGLTRTISGDSGSAASTWAYTRTVSGSTSQTSVTDGLQNKSMYNFVLGAGQSYGVTANYYETSRSIYQGSGGTPLLNRATCYNGVSQPCTSTALTLPIAQIDTYETLNGVQQHGITQKYNTYGLETEEDDYDYGGASSRGALLRKEVWAYPSSGIVSLVSSDTVYDGFSNMVSQTAYGYDGSPVVASSGVPQHVDVSGNRGNLVAVNQYANSSDLIQTSSYKYEDTGSVLSATTPNGTTTYSYDGTFTYQQGVTPPTPSSGVSLPTSATYETAHTGLPMSSTDPNGTKTQVASYDDMLRPNEVDTYDSGGNMVGKTVYDWPNPNGYSILKYQSGAAISNNGYLLDIYGRPSRQALSNGQSTNAWYLRDTCYDANGNIAFQSYRYQGSAWSTAKACSGSGDTSTYDALGRISMLTHADGSFMSYTYLGRTTKVVDESGVTKISQIDGLGRITGICEVSSKSLQVGTATSSPVACGTDITGMNGFITNYAYDFANHKMTVTQAAQTRTFQTDWLGRATSAQEPERGPTTYSYAYNGTGLVVTRQKPKANQTNSSVLTTTTAQYDALGRILSVSYTDGTAPKNFYYDAPVGWSGYSQNNSVKSRFSYAVMTPAGATYGITTAYIYNPMGQVTGMGECTPATCGVSAYNLSYAYDWLGNLKSSTDASGIQTSYAYTPANEVNGITSSWQDATHLGTLVSNVQNGPNGPLSYTLGNGVGQSFSYDGLGRRNGEWACKNGSVNPCPSGTLLYGYIVNWQGSRLQNSADTSLGQQTAYGYDDFNRLSSRTITAGTAQNYTYTYDLYGNRWAQNALQGGNQSNLTFDATTNHVTGTGVAYDAAGNMTADGTGNQYSYDAEGNLIQEVAPAGTVNYTYNALNQQIRTDFLAFNDATENVFNQAGQLDTVWEVGTGRIIGKAYWGSTPFESYDTGTNMAFFQHRDWNGSERLITNASAAVTDVQVSLPFGDGFLNISGGRDNSFDGYDGYWDGATSITNHTQYREYANNQGRWLQPDPYSGSYDFSNPQSFNRYAYVLNNPLSFTDPLGLILCDYGPSDQGGEDTEDDMEGAQDCTDGGGSVVTDVQSVAVNGNGTNGDYLSLLEYGGTSTVIQYIPGSASNKGTNLFTIPGTNHCGPGGAGIPTNRVDSACQAHDACYDFAGASWKNNVGLATTTPQQRAAINNCDAALSNAIRNISWPTSAEMGQATIVSTYFNLPSGYSLNPNLPSIPLLPQLPYPAF